MHLVDLRQTGTGQDGVRFAAKLISKIGYLANGIGSSDFRLTEQQMEVQQILNRELRGHLSALDALLAKELAAFNEMRRHRSVPNVVVRSRSASE